MYESLPLPLCDFVVCQAGRMGLPGPDDYILLLICLDKQCQDVQAALHPDTPPLLSPE